MGCTKISRHFDGLIHEFLQQLNMYRTGTTLNFNCNFLATKDVHIAMPEGSRTVAGVGVERQAGGSAGSGCAGFK